MHILCLQWLLRKRCDALILQQPRNNRRSACQHAGQRGTTTLISKVHPKGEAHLCCDDKTCTDVLGRQMHVLTRRLKLTAHTHITHTHTAQTQTIKSSKRVKSWEGELTMACMFNRNLFICLNRRQKNERSKKEETQHKNGWTTCYAN